MLPRLVRPVWGHLCTHWRWAAALPTPHSWAHRRAWGPAGRQTLGYHRRALLKAGGGRRRKRSPNQDQGQSMPCLATRRNQRRV